MNQRAERHIAKAGEYLGKGEGLYRKAAAEMRAAKNEGATWGEIARALGHQEKWCRRIVSWAEGEGSAPTPFSEPGRETTDVRGTRRILREAPLEQVEQIIAELPPDRQKAVAAAAGHEYLKARNEYDEEQARMPASGGKERQAAAEGISEAGRKAAAGFLALGIAGHIEQATEELRELVADASLTPESWATIRTAIEALLEEATVAAGMVGLDLDLEGTLR